MLPKRPLGRTGVMISPLGLGTVKLGRDRGVKYPEPFTIPDDAAAAGLLRLAQKLGITLLDTAPAYGESEERLGRIIGAAGGRHRWTIVTKAGEEFDPQTGESRYDFSPAAIGASVERSLRRLRVNALDCVLLHSDGRDEWILKESGAVDALQRLKKKGLARLFGISAKSAEGALAAAEAPLDVLMVTLNPEDRSCLPAIRAAHERGMGVLIKKALSSGRLAAQAEGGASRDPVAAAMECCFAEPGVSSIVVGTINPRHLEANAEAAGRVLGE